MSKKIVFENKKQVDILREKIVSTTNAKLKMLWQSGEGIDFLRNVKFEPCGYDPLFEHDTNFIEQTNQTFTYLVCLVAVDILLSKHPSHKFTVSFGTESGYDVVSEDSSIICECFAVTAPDSNGKLEKDTRKVFENTDADNKYVIFYSSNPKPIHIENIRKKYSDVDIIALQKI
ncbi:MAG: hypothetical protein VB060_03085 [Oscillibacter sp.]|nr:hypothetical protein [Oscillibacter sp.]MEA4992808.1 hypothetical protein [Oscillibacter sp.]